MNEQIRRTVNRSLTAGMVLLLLRASASVYAAQDPAEDQFGSVISFVNQHSPLITLSPEA